MQLEIPLAAVPAQQVSVVLNNQDCTLALYMRGDDFYFDLTVNDTPIITGLIVRINQPLSPYTSSFIGNIYMLDLNGSEDPQYTGLGERWRLIYTDL